MKPADRESQIAVLVDHAQRPRHKGPLAEADAAVPGGTAGCDDLITLYLEAEREGDRVAAASFEGTGCTISQAAASLLLERVNRERPRLEELLEFPYDEMIEMLGKEVVGSRLSCATLALGTLKAAARRVLMDRKLRAAGRSDEEIRQLREALEAGAVPAVGIPRAAGAEEP